MSSADQERITPVTVETQTAAAPVIQAIPEFNLPTLQLEPPEVIQPVKPEQIPGAVKLPDEMQARIKEQLDGFMQALLSGDPKTPEFQSQLDKAFSVGRKEIETATTLSNSFTERNLIGLEDDPASKALLELRGLFDDLNPARQGDLFAPTRFLGIPIPFAKKLNAYLRRYQGAGEQITKLTEQLLEAKDAIRGDIAELDVARQQMWAALEKLEGVAFFIRSLDERMSAEIDRIKPNDADRAKVLEQEVLFYIRQNLADVQTSQALSINAYAVLGELKKTGREVVNACDRMATIGRAALTVAVTLARATDRQQKTMEMVQATQKTIEDLIVHTGVALNEHVNMTTRFAQDPALGVKTLQTMFDQTFKAMDTMDNYRTQALATMAENNRLIKAQIDTARKRLDMDPNKPGAQAEQGITL